MESAFYVAMACYNPQDLFKIFSSTRCVLLSSILAPIAFSFRL